MKLSKQEKAFVKGYVELMEVKCSGLEAKDSSWLENECTKIIDNRFSEYRYAVEDFITELIEKKNK